jgi:arsenate reductase (glutaredoxin)
MDMITIWHNPRCSKSRQALALLEGKTDVQVRKYLEDAPSETEIRAALAALGNPPAITMMRTGEKQFKELGLTRTTDDAALIAAMAQHPILIERPIAFAANHAVIGRPPENVLALI